MVDYSSNGEVELAPTWKYGLLTIAINWLPGLVAAIHIISMYRHNFKACKTMLAARKIYIPKFDFYDNLITFYYYLPYSLSLKLSCKTCSYCNRVLSGPSTFCLYSVDVETSRFKH